MSSIRIILLGTILGIILSVLSLGSAYVAASILTGTSQLPLVIIVSTIVNGAILGTTSIGLSYLTSGYERTLLVLLVSLATAALTVMLGRYADGSLLPLGIYSLAVLNSFLISKATGRITHRSQLPDERIVSG
ncbi:MAG: hypothetical protein R3293_04520 [Candidatus Promineifilaceae bacterium]|nr:hypothetical protein [Candidatus Promineifilaceae bacterium]